MAFSYIAMLIHISMALVYLLFIQIYNLQFAYTFVRYLVGVVYPKNSSDIWNVIWLMPSDVTYCESVFRRSLIENVEVFLAKGRYETTLTFV